MSGPSPAATTYVYDALGRLSTASYDNGKQVVYGYDPAGNRSQVITQATPPARQQAIVTKHKKPRARR